MFQYQNGDEEGSVRCLPWNSTNLAYTGPYHIVYSNPHILLPLVLSPLQNPYPLHRPPLKFDPLCTIFAVANTSSNVLHVRGSHTDVRVCTKHVVCAEDNEVRETWQMRINGFGGQDAPNHCSVRMRLRRASSWLSARHLNRSERTLGLLWRPAEGDRLGHGMGSRGHDMLISSSVTRTWLERCKTLISKPARA